MKRSNIIGALSNWLAFALALAIAFFLTPYLIRALGQAKYDVWCVVEAILAYFTLLDLGVGACLLRSSAQCYAEKNYSQLNRVASSCLAVFAAAGAMAIVIGLPITWAMSPRLGDASQVSQSSDTFFFMLIMLVNLAITLPLSIYPTILEGLEKFTEKSAVRISSLILRTIGYILATWNSNSLLPLAIISIVITILENMVMAWLCYRYLPELRMSRKLVNRATLREVQGYSVYAFLSMLAGRITLQTGAIVIGLLMPIGSATAFTTAARLIDYAKTLLRTITATLTPGIAAMEAKGDWAGIRKITFSATRMVLLLAIPVTIGLAMFGKPFLIRWVGEELANRAYVPLLILNFTLLIGVVQSVASRIMYGLGQLKWFAWLALAEAVVNVILTFLLITNWQLSGVAFAVMLPNILFCLATITMACRAIGIPIIDYLKSMLPCLWLGIVPFVTWLLLGPAEANWPSLAAKISAGCIAYALAVGLWLWRGKTSDRKRTINNQTLVSTTLNTYANS